MCMSRIKVDIRCLIFLDLGLLGINKERNGLTTKGYLRKSGTFLVIFMEEAQKYLKTAMKLPQMQCLWPLSNCAFKIYTIFLRSYSSKESELVKYMIV